MRTPLILLIVVWTLSIAGLTVIPGVEIDGETRYLTVFEAFYFVSYMATTIGFGEPHFGFTDMQRLWVSFTLYLTVVSWLFAIGNIISLLQDPRLQIVWRRYKFTRQVKSIKEDFLIICGFGETGELLLDNLWGKGFQCVVVDSDAERINVLNLKSSAYGVPYLLGDAGDVETLKIAGLLRENCRAVLAVTKNDQTNVKVAVTAKLLHSGVKVICRAHSKEAMANAKSFDTDHIINANRIFAENISRAFRTPSIQQLTTSLLRRSGRNYFDYITPPKGHWIVCGYDDFGKEMVKFLDYEGMDYSIISDDENITVPHVHGRGTEAVSLRAAGIDKAVGIIAGTADDTDNFSIIMTARHVKPNLFLAARQNQESNRLIFQNAEIDVVMESSRLMVWRIAPLITQPWLATFLRLARHRDEAWGQELMAKLAELSDSVPATYRLRFDGKRASAVINYLYSDNILRLQELYVADSSNPDKPMAIPLMLVRDGKEELLPKLSTPLKAGDVFLMASTEAARDQVLYTIAHEQDFYYVIHGEEKPVSIVMYKLRNYWKDFKTYRRKQRKQRSVTKQAVATESNNESAQ